MKSKIVFALILVAILFTFVTKDLMAGCGGGCTAYPYVHGCIYNTTINGRNAYEFYVTNTGAARTYEIFLSCHYENGSTKWLSHAGFNGTVAPLFVGLIPTGTHKISTMVWSNFTYLGKEQHFRFDRTVDGICGNVCDSGISH